MKTVYFISEEVQEYNPCMTGMGRCALAHIRLLAQDCAVKVLTLKFRGQKDSEAIGENIQLIRIPTSLSLSCEDFFAFFSHPPDKITRAYFEFSRNIEDFFDNGIEPNPDTVVQLFHGFASALLAAPLKNRGFRVLIMFHWLRFQRYLRPVFSPRTQRHDYDLCAKPWWQRLALIFAARCLRNEKALAVLFGFFYSLRVQWLLPLSARFYYETEVRAPVYADKTAVLNQGMKDYLLWLNPALSPSCIEVTANGIEESYFSPIDSERVEQARKRWEISAAEEVLLFIGRLDPMKGLEYLIEALKIMRQDHESPGKKRILLVVGAPTGAHSYYKDYLVRQASLAGGRVIFTGPVYEENEKLALYDLSSVFILPSVYEPFGIVALEAMARGRPVVVTDACGVQRCVSPDCGTVVRYDTELARAENLAQAISAALESRAPGISEDASRLQALNFRWQSLREGIYQFYFA